MDLWTKIVESEALGYVTSTISGSIRRIMASSRERHIDEKLNAAREEHDAEIARTADAFIAAHPELAPETFGIPKDRYSPIAYMTAVQAISMLLGRYADFHSMDDTCLFDLRMDGTVSASDGKDLIPAETMQNEVGMFIFEMYIPALTEMTWSYRKARRLERERIRSHSSHPMLFLRWVQTALRTQPDLMFDHRVVHASPDGSAVTLVAVRRSADEDPLIPWRT